MAMRRGPISLDGGGDPNGEPVPNDSPDPRGFRQGDSPDPASDPDIYGFRKEGPDTHDIKGGKSPDTYGFRADASSPFASSAQAAAFAANSLAEGVTKAALAAKQLAEQLEETAKKAAAAKEQKAKKELKKYRKSLEDHAERAKGDVGQIAGFAKDAVGNNSLGAFNKVLDATSARLEANAESLGSFGKSALGASKALGVVGAGFTAFVEVVGAINRRAAELARYSSDIAASQAQRSVLNLQSDIKEAQALGKSISSVDEASSAIERDLRSILLPIKQFLIDSVGDYLEKSRPLLENLAAAADSAREFYGKNKDKFASAVTTAQRTINPLQSAIDLVTAFLTRQETKAIQDIGAETLDALDRSIMSASKSADSASAVGLNVPIFGGR